MRLPNAERANVDPAKVRDYLLSSTHAEGRGKAQFFMGFGFNLDNPHELRDALLALAKDNEVSSLQTSNHGTKYVIDGRLAAPDGRAPMVRTVWIVDADASYPRFVTAYAGKRSSP
jgi:hypothetical protein